MGNTGIPPCALPDHHILSQCPPTECSFLVPFGHNSRILQVQFRGISAHRKVTGVIYDLKTEAVAPVAKKTILQNSNSLKGNMALAQSVIPTLSPMPHLQS